MQCLRSTSQRRGLDTNTLLAKDIQHEVRGSIVLVDLGRALGISDLIQILVEEVRTVHGTTLGFGVELGGEDGSRLVHHAFVATVVQVDKVLLEVAGQGAGINGVAMVLAGNVALASCQIQGGDVVSSVTILELDGAGANGQGQKLVAEANSHDGHRRGVHQTSEVVDRVLTVCRVTGTVRDENAVVVIGHLVNRVVVREDGDGGTTADQAADDVLLDTTVDQSDVQVGSGGLNNEGGLGAHALNEINLARIGKALVLVGVILLTDGDSGKRGTLLTKKCDNLARVHARDGRHALTSAPLAKTFHGGPMAVLQSHIGHDDPGTLEVRGLEILEKVVLVTLGRRHAVVANQRLGEDQNLSTVRRIRHGFAVSHERGGEDGFARNVGICTKGRAIEDGAVSNSQCGWDRFDRGGSPG